MKKKEKTFLKKFVVCIRREFSFDIITFIGVFRIESGFQVAFAKGAFLASDTISSSDCPKREKRTKKKGSMIIVFPRKIIDKLSSREKNKKKKISSPACTIVCDSTSVNFNNTEIY